MKFQQYLQESQDAQMHLHALLFLMEADLDSLTESEDGLNEAFDRHLNKVGLKLHKSKGILDYIKSFATGIGKVLLYIIKGEHDKAKELIKSMKKEDFLDFIYKLDLGTLHLITGPLHMIDAWTGWDLGVNLQSHMKKAEGLTTVLKQAIDKIKHSIQQIFDGNKQTKLLHYVNKIEASVA